MATVRALPTSSAEPESTRDREHLALDDLDQLLAALPPPIRESLKRLEDLTDLLEIVLDLGREPEARFPGREALLSSHEVAEEDLEYVVSRIGEFGNDNRAGIERTLHRISALRNRRGKIVGVTCRVGRAVHGTIDIIRDFVELGRSLLILGRPGIGKTTMLREVARVLADDFRKRVVVVDTSNEIAGDGDIPHLGIGSARRMQVPTPDRQHAVMIEAVENHMPEVVIIDEIGTQLESEAARTIAERGVQLVGTAHGNTLENIMMNPTLSDLIGGIQPVTLGDEEARRRGTQKTVLERKAPPTFEVLVEMQERQRVCVHADVAETVDRLLRGQPITVEVRERQEDSSIRRHLEQVMPGGDELRPGRSARRSGSELLATSEFGGEILPGERIRRADRRARQARTADVQQAEEASVSRPARRRTLVYPFGINRDRLEQAMRTLGIPSAVTKELREATLVMTLKNYYRKNPAAVREAEERGVPVHVLKSNTVTQMQQALAGHFGIETAETAAPRSVPAEPEELVVMETQDAIDRVLQTSRPVELPPGNAYIRRLQHQLAETYQLGSRSLGREPRRRVQIFKPVRG